MPKKKNFTDKQYAYLLDELLKEIESKPKLKPDRDEWDVEGSWQECGDVYFIASQHMSDFATWRDFGCKTIKLINYGKPAVRMSFFSKHKYWLKKPHDLSAEEQNEYLTEYINNMSLSVLSLQNRLDQLPPVVQSQTKAKIETTLQEIEAWQRIRESPTQYELAISTYQRGYAYLYISYKYILPSGEFTNESEHLLHHTRDRLGNITQSKQNIIFVDTNEIYRVHPQQNKEIENYLNRFSMKSSTGPKWLYARPRLEADGRETFELQNPVENSGQLDLFND